MTIAESLQAWIDLDTIEQLKRERDRRFPIGSVVRREDGPRGTACRGIVTAHGNTRLAGMSTDMTVRLSHNVEHHSNDLDAWERVPYEQQTVEERVRAHAVSYSPVMDGESYAWGLLGALLPPRTWDRMTDGVHDWPTETDFAIELARWIDRKLRMHTQLLDAVDGES